MGLPLRKEDKKFNYADYLTWSDDERWEIIDGFAYNMTPAPSREHQEILGELFNQIKNYLKDKNCKVYVAPFDVRFSEEDEADEEIITVVQPDISIICDLNKIDKKGCKGAPDFIIEIASPSTALKDMREKLNLYERYGVKEYWIVQPENKIVMVYKLGKDKKYKKPEIFAKEEKIKISIFEGLTIDLSPVFNYRNI